MKMLIQRDVVSQQLQLSYSAALLERSLKHGLHALLVYKDALQRARHRRCFSVGDPQVNRVHTS